MKPEAQLIAIAEACGWENVRETEFGLLGSRPKNDLSIMPGDYLLPGYLNDLNAMHEAEGIIKAPHIHNEYLEMAVLGYIMKGKDSVAEFMVRRATAAQRAESFLRTIGKWEAQP